MLLKIETVAEIGRFAVFRHKAPEFKPLTLVFARNGYGKSTICSILRSASTNDPNQIHSRKRLDAKNESRVHLKWANFGIVDFGGDKWNVCPGKIYVFDQDYILQNLHVGESVTRDNKRNLLPVVLGEKGVTLANTISNLDAEQRELSKALIAADKQIRARHPVLHDSDLVKFCLGDIPEDINTKISSAQKEVELAKQAEAIKPRRGLQTIPLSAMAVFQEIAGRAIEHVSKDAAARVRAHMERHSMDRNGDRWVKYGIDHVVGDSCPFCEQSTKDNELIDAYCALFSDAFSLMAADTDSAIVSLRSYCAASGNALDKIVQENDDDLRFWGTVCDVDEAPVLRDEDARQTKDALSKLLGRLERKRANLPIAENIDDILSELHAVFQLIDTYNSRVMKVVKIIDSARKAASVVNLIEAEKKHKKWIAFNEKEREPLRSEIAAFVKAEARKKEIETEKKAAQIELARYSTLAVSSRQDEINQLLSDFGANFSIVDTKANFIGREPNTEYSICVGTQKVKAGEKSDTDPSFKTLLSAGDKTTLALALFLSQIRADAALENAVIVFDDPFSSQDMQRQFETTSQIRSVSESACQTLVFSHDPRFLNMIEKDASKASVGEFQLQCTDAGEGSISLWSSSNELKSVYVRQAEAIQEYANHENLLSDVTTSSLVMDLRPFLESYIQARFPGRFETRVMLAAMADAIEATGHGDPMFVSVADLRSVNEYTRPNHHGGGQAVDPQALRAQCKKIVRLVGAY